MSVVALSEADKIYKKSFHRRNDSGELDVFEAARYFSGGGANNEIIGYNGAIFPQRMITREEKQSWRGGRISLDMPPVIMRNTLPITTTTQSTHAHAHAHSHVHTHAAEKQKIKYKQPSSPGGRLASFLNSLFNQANSKKKKSKSSSSVVQSMKDEEEISPEGRRKRRSSISHFRSSSTTADSKSSSSSGFRTPPPYANTPTKTYKDFRSSYSEQRQPVSGLPNCNGKNNNVRGMQSNDQAPLEVEKRIKELAWLDEKFRFASQKAQHNNININRRINSEKERICWGDDEECYPTSEEKVLEFRKLDDGADSDSSSDLFELQNYELGCCYSSGLPVYETTHMDSIRRGAPPLL